jgi:hypothetical protein
MHMFQPLASWQSADDRCHGFRALAERCDLRLPYAPVVHLLSSSGAAARTPTRSPDK